MIHLVVLCAKLLLNILLNVSAPFTGGCDLYTLTGKVAPRIGCHDLSPRETIDGGNYTFMKEIYTVLNDSLNLRNAVSQTFIPTMPRLMK